MHVEWSHAVEHLGSTVSDQHCLRPCKLVQAEIEERNTAQSTPISFSFELVAHRTLVVLFPVAHGPWVPYTSELHRAPSL